MSRLGSLLYTWKLMKCFDNKNNLTLDMNYSISLYTNILKSDILKIKEKYNVSINTIISYALFKLINVDQIKIIAFGPPIEGIKSLNNYSYYLFTYKNKDTLRKLDKKIKSNYLMLYSSTLLLNNYKQKIITK